MAIHPADPTRQVIPSFKLRAARRLAELSRLVIVLQLTEAWNTAGIEKLQAEGRYFRHTLRTLNAPGSLSLDEQRYICERLLPFLPEESDLSFVEPEPTTPALIPMRLSVGPPQIEGLPGQTATLVVGVLKPVPAGSLLFLLHDGRRFLDPVPAVAGTSRHIDPEPGVKYIAQIWYQGQLIGQASATLGKLVGVRWGVMRGLQPTTKELENWQLAGPGTVQQLNFSVPEGRYYLGILVTASSACQVVDNRASLAELLPVSLDATLDITPSFVPQAVRNQPALKLLRQPMVSVGPFNFLAQLNLS